MEKVAIMTPQQFNEDYKDYRCPECHRDGLETFYNFCPECGAKLKWELPEDTTPFGQLLKSI